MSETKTVLILCTGNSCRSQMAEGLARHLGKGIIEPYSAGLFVHHVQPGAIAVMKEIGIDISGQKSKNIDEELLRTMDMVITLCGHAEETCPVTPPYIKRIHWPINDPVGTGEAATDFLGTQGDVWDTQWDMFLALVGAVVSQGLFSRLHDREIRELRR